MASNLLLLSILILKLLIFTDAQPVGVCNGRLGQKIPSEQATVNLYKRNGITRMRIYDPNPDTLRALGGTDIELILDVPNAHLPGLADPNAAVVWVRNNIRNYPNVRFRYISVGNEVDPSKGSPFANSVLPAMKNIQKAINEAGLRIKVSTATYTGLLKDPSYPPNVGAFKDNVVPYIQPIIRFLVENNSPMLANIYPYFAYLGSSNVELPYALFTKPDNGEQYKNLFDAMYDAHYVAQSRLGGANVPIVVSESGWPDFGNRGATKENAGTYYRKLIEHVKSGKGTPLCPGRVIETYLFAMFNENQKDGEETERHFGVFYLDQRHTSKYNLRF